MEIKNNKIIKINGQHFGKLNGSVITIVNHKMLVNGKPIEDLESINPDEKVINITIEGSVEELQVDYCNSIKINGSVKRVKSTSGDITISGNALGNVYTTSGDVNCGDVGEDVSTSSGDIHCGNVKGRVSTYSGDIYKR